MAAPQRKLRYRASWERTARERESGSTLPKRAPEREGRNRVRNARAFVVMVVVPMLLMLGSVYVHTLNPTPRARENGLRCGSRNSPRRGELES